MKLPIDVMAVFQEAMDVDAARSVPLCVSVLLDDTAPADLMAYVRSSFASASQQARVSVNYFTDGSAVFDPRSDMAVIAAGITPEVGAIAARIRESRHSRHGGNDAARARVGNGARSGISHS
ncbi:MAG: hypothetical protein ACLRX5_02500 [Slackia sp.]